MAVSKELTGYLHITEDYYIFARVTKTPVYDWKNTIDVSTWLNDKALEGHKIKLTVEVLDDE